MKIIDALFAIKTRYVRCNRQCVNPLALCWRTNLAKKAAGAASMKVSLYLVGALCSFATLPGDVAAGRLLERAKANWDVSAAVAARNGQSLMRQCITQGMGQALQTMFLVQLFHAWQLKQVEAVAVFWGSKLITASCIVPAINYLLHFQQVQRLTERFLFRFASMWFCATLYHFCTTMLPIFMGVGGVSTPVEIGRQESAIFSKETTHVRPAGANHSNNTLVHVAFFNPLIFGGMRVLTDSAFQDFKALVSVFLPTSVERIGQYAFGRCSRLSTVHMSDNVKEIGRGAFYRCTSLQQITLSAGVETIGDDAFCYCTALQSVDIPGKNLLCIDTGAFCNTQLRSLDLSGHPNLCSSAPGVIPPNEVRPEVVLQAFLASNKLTIDGKYADFAINIFSGSDSPPPDGFTIRFFGGVECRYSAATQQWVTMR
ncbi:MAG: leucine-rich repeat domain-containing protein [Holosporales bacterium]|jgi:hypothetical protein|nr:leucine-rich repeat domain-containing protein [Holosporales bacterium]